MIYWKCKRCGERNSNGLDKCGQCHAKREQSPKIVPNPVPIIQKGVLTRLVRFTIHGQPLPKARPRLSRRRAYTPKKTKDYERLVKQVSGLAISEQFVGDVFVHIVFYRRTKHRVDIDNLAKAVLDGMNEVAYKDDSQIKKLFLELEYDKKKPRSEITICNVSEWQSALGVAA